MTIEEGYQILSRDTNMRTLKVSIVGLCLILAVMADSTPESQIGPPHVELVSSGINQFATALFQPFLKYKAQNFVWSPTIADITLAMAAFGSAGETKSQLERALHIPPLDSDLAVGYGAFVADLNNTMYFNITSSIFINRNVTVKTAYYQFLLDYFKTNLTSVDFHNPKDAANIINKSVQDGTKDPPGHVEDIISPSDLEEKVGMILASGMHFKGEWKFKFNPKFTQQRLFWINKNSTKSVSTMRIICPCRYGYIESKNNAEFIILPYKGDYTFMLIVIPQEVDGLPQLEQDLTKTNMSDIFKAASIDAIELYLPKFKIQNKMELNSALFDIGVKDMFEPNANFSAITDDKLRVNRVQHSASITVDENGTDVETGVDVELRLSVIGKPKILDVNRPFFYAVLKVVKRSVYDWSLVTLLSGHVVEPTM